MKVPSTQQNPENDIKNLVDKVDIERDRADKYGKQINDQLDTIKKLEVEVRGLKHDNKRLRDDNVDIKRNADIKINKYMAEFKEPEPEPEQIEGEGVNMAEPTEPPEPQKPSEPEPDKFTCKVCGQEAKTLHYLKMHVQRSKDADHQAYLEEDF